MTPERAKELLPIITAFAEGASIERRRYDEVLASRWLEISNPYWSDVYEYRIKPKVPEYRIVKNARVDIVYAERRNTNYDWEYAGEDKRVLTDWLPIPNLDK